MHRAIAALLGIGLFPVAAVMLIAPALWYERYPGVLESGPFNDHFVRDLGGAFIAAASAFLYAAIRPEGARNLVTVAAGILVLHAIIHLGEGALGDHFGWRIVDVPSVYLPAILASACAISWPWSQQQG